MFNHGVNSGILTTVGNGEKVKTTVMTAVMPLLPVGEL